MLYVFDSKGDKLELAVIRMEMMKGTAPMMSGFRLGNEGEQTRISPGSIDHVHVPVVRAKKWVGLFVGVALDIPLHFLVRELSFVHLH